MAPISPTSASPVSGEIAGTHADPQVLAELIQLWQQHRQRGLEVRHQTGLVLNKQFGPPTARQPYGFKTLRHYSKHLGLAESELSRMRWFAHHFSALEVLKAQHPAVITWTQVKELLSSLQDPPEKTAAAKGIRKTKPVAKRQIRRIVQAMRVVQTHVAKVQHRPSDADRTALLEALDRMTKAVEQCLAVTESPATDVSEEKSAPLINVAHCGTDKDIALHAVPKTPCLNDCDGSEAIMIG